jgi:hypothetical protein
LRRELGLLRRRELRDLGRRGLQELRGRELGLLRLPLRRRHLLRALGRKLCLLRRCQRLLSCGLHARGTRPHSLWQLARGTPLRLDPEIELTDLVVRPLPLAIRRLIASCHDARRLLLETPPPVGAPYSLTLRVSPGLVIVVECTHARRS